MTVIGCSKWLDGGECGGQWGWTETVRDGRNSNRCDSKTQENTHMTKWGGGREGGKKKSIL